MRKLFLLILAIASASYAHGESSPSVKDRVGLYKIIFGKTEACYAAITPGTAPDTVLVTMVGECPIDTHSIKYTQIDTHLFETGGGYRAKFSDDGDVAFTQDGKESSTVGKKATP
jgi:hypothetical protein